MGWRLSRKTDNFVFADLSNLIFLIQCLLRISISGHSIACLSADEKTFLGVERFLVVLRDLDPPTGHHVDRPYVLLDVARPPIPAQTFSRVWLGHACRRRIVLSFLALQTSHR